MYLSVIIVNYNVKYFLEYCLLSVRKACEGIEYEVFVVDNNSGDGSREYLEPKFPWVKFRWRKENLGFSKANNSALSEAAGDHILFLNPDTIVAENSFNICLNFFKAHPDCGALGVRMIDGSGQFLRESKRGLPTFLNSFYKTLSLANRFPRSKKFAGYYAAHLPEDRNNKVEVLAGAFMMLSRAAIESTKGFDENFFMYGEDVDLSYRISRAGFSNYYCADTTIIHFKGESTQKQSKSYKKYFYGSMKSFAKKHYRKPRTKYMLTVAGIAIAKAIGRKPAAQGVQHAAARHTIIEGTESEGQNVQAIMAKARQFIIDDQSTLDSVSGSSPNAAIVLCEGTHSFRQVIDRLQKLPQDCTALIYAHGASSIIGSSNKDTGGIFISAQQ